MQFQVVQPGASRTRKQRRPSFPIAGTLRPYGLYPLCIHPVLPGETLQSWTTKWRVLSMPVKHPLCGAWLESWLVYVKLTDLDRELGQMFVSKPEDFSAAPYAAASASDRYFTNAGQIDWVRLCTDRIANSFFRHENEEGRTIDGVPQIKLMGTSFYQNAIFEQADEPVLTGDIGDLGEQLTAFQMMQQMAMTELTYEKYLEQYGVQSIVTGIGEPEVFRYARSWALPVNTVNPADGSPSTAWVWSDKMDASKPKRMDEPGFLVQLASIRPKMFQGNVGRSMVGNLWGFQDWFPAYNLDDPMAGARQISNKDDVFSPSATGVAPQADLIYDHRDLLSHGEQFINTSEHPYSLPLSTGLDLDPGKTPEDWRGEYCNTADVDNLFVSPDPTGRVCYYEGMSQATISGHITDTTR